MALPKGQAFALLAGGQIWKIRMPLPDSRTDPQMPASVDSIARKMWQRHTTGDHWWRTDSSLAMPPTGRGSHA